MVADAAASKEEVEKDSPYYPAKELLENEKVLREFVRAHIGIPAVKIEENKKRIKEWTKRNGWRIRYIPDTQVEDQFAKFNYDEEFRKANPHIENAASNDKEAATAEAQDNT
jgi:hypothetical protein